MKTVPWLMVYLIRTVLRESIIRTEYRAEIRAGISRPKTGTSRDAVVGGEYESDMPGFGDSLRDAEIRAILDYIKSRWPDREKAAQEDITRADIEAQQ